MYNNAKKNTFETETESIFKQAQTDFINDSITHGAGGRIYCKISDSKYGSCPSGSTELQMTTTKDYLVVMNSDGKVNYLGVADKSYVFGYWPSEVTDIKKCDCVLDASDERVKDKFKLDSSEYYDPNDENVYNTYCTIDPSRCLK